MSGFSKISSSRHLKKYTKDLKSGFFFFLVFAVEIKVFSRFLHYWMVYYTLRKGLLLHIVQQSNAQSSIKSKDWLVSLDFIKER